MRSAGKPPRMCEKNAEVSSDKLEVGWRRKIAYGWNRIGAIR